MYYSGLDLEIDDLNCNPSNPLPIAFFVFVPGTFPFQQINLDSKICTPKKADV